MHLDSPPAQVRITARLVRELLRAQHADLAERPLRRLGSGWDTEVFRLGLDLCVRVPRRSLGAQPIGTEARWLPQLAAHLPLAVPTPLRLGEPTSDFPWPWTVCAHVPGRPLGADRWSGARGLRAADTLVAFLGALHRPAPAAAPVNALRGRPLTHRSETVETAMPSAPQVLRPHLVRAWAAALATPEYRGPALWVHGDLHPHNVLVARGAITGIIDFGDLGGGDPATDLAVAWLLLDRVARQRLRAGLRVDDGAWERARGWALFFGLMFHRHSRSLRGDEVMGRRVLTEALAPD